MKNRTHTLSLINLGLTVILLALIGCGSSTSAFAELVSQGNELRTYEVFGMDCPGCHGGLENLVSALPGVMGAQANWENSYFW